jgi:hypothetical protein
MNEAQAREYCSNCTHAVVHELVNARGQATCKECKQACRSCRDQALMHPSNFKNQRCGLPQLVQLKHCLRSFPCNTTAEQVRW